MLFWGGRRYSSIEVLRRRHFVADPVDRARSLGGVNDITLAYQGVEAQHLLHLRVGLIRHSVPDDLEDAEAVVGEILSASGDFNLVLQQDGVVSVKEDGELFATEIVCEVPEGEQQRRLSILLSGLWAPGWWVVGKLCGLR